MTFLMSQAWCNLNNIYKWFFWLHVVDCIKILETKLHKNLALLSWVYINDNNSEFIIIIQSSTYKIKLLRHRRLACF